MWSYLSLAALAVAFVYSVVSVSAAVCATTHENTYTEAVNTIVSSAIHMLNRISTTTISFCLDFLKYNFLLPHWMSHTLFWMLVATYITHLRSPHTLENLRLAALESLRRVAPDLRNYWEPVERLIDNLLNYPEELDETIAAPQQQVRDPEARPPCPARCTHEDIDAATARTLRYKNRAQKIADEKTALIASNKNLQRELDDALRELSTKPSVVQRERLNREKEAEITEIRQQHKEKRASIRQQYRDHVDHIKEQHTAEVVRINRQHAAEVVRINRQHAAETGALNNHIANLQNRNPPTQAAPNQDAPSQPVPACTHETTIAEMQTVIDNLRQEKASHERQIQSFQTDINELRTSRDSLLQDQASQKRQNEALKTSTAAHEHNTGTLANVKELLHRMATDSDIYIRLSATFFVSCLAFNGADTASFGIDLERFKHYSTWARAFVERRIAPVIPTDGFRVDGARFPVSQRWGTGGVVVLVAGGEEVVMADAPGSPAIDDAYLRLPDEVPRVQRARSSTAGSAGVANQAPNTTANNAWNGASSPAANNAAASAPQANNASAFRNYRNSARDEEDEM